MFPTPFSPSRPAANGPADGPSNSPTDGPPISPSTACFAVHAASGPAVMPRVLGVFAKRGLVPLQCHSVLCPAPGCYRQQDIHIDIQVAGMEQTAAVRLAEDLRKVVGVIAVLTSRKQYALTA